MNYQQNLDNFISEYQTSINVGLSSKEANDRLKKYGYNILDKKRKTSFITRFLIQFKDFLVIILLISAIVSTIINPNDWLDSLIILVVVLINGIIGFIQETSAEKALEAISNLNPYQVKVIRDSKTLLIESKLLVPGDLIILETGNYIPADARLIDSYNLCVDESSLTGESIPINKTINTEHINTDVNLNDLKDCVFASTYVTTGNGKAIVYHTGMNTQIGKIAKLLVDHKTPNTPLQLKLTQIGKIIGIICLLLCTIVFFLKLFIGSSLQDSFITAIALAVASIPEGLATIVTIILAMGVNKMATKKAIVKKLPAVETLGCASVICSDKTGTLTQNKMTITYCYTHTLKKINDYLSFDDIRLLELLALCTNAKVEYVNNKTVEIGDPTEIALLNARNIYVENPEFTHLDKVFEIPFDSNRKLMTVVYKYHHKYLIITKGAPDALINIVCNPAIAKKGLIVNEQMAKKALRVLGLAYKELIHLPKTLDQDSIENNLHFLGLVGMIDPPRPEVKESIQIAKLAGIKIVMITGDHILTAKAIAKELDIYHDYDLALTSNTLSDYSDEELIKVINKVTIVARATPEDKVRIVKTWQKLNQVVAVTGDGINDAPALKIAQIGCAMGITGTDVAKEAADLILVDDNFETIVSAVKEGRNVYANIKKVVKFLLSSNIGEVFIIIITLVLYAIFGSPLIHKEGPLLAIHLLWINLITDSLPAFALGCEKNYQNIMEDPPRNNQEHFFANGFLKEIILEGIMVGSLAFFSYLIGNTYSYQTGQTMAFITLATTQLFHAFNCKTTRSILNNRIFDNFFLVIAFIIGLILELSICYIPRLAFVFKVIPLPLDLLAITIGLSFSSIIMVETIKLFKNKTNHSKH